MGKEKSRNFTFLLYPDEGKVFLMIGKNVWKKSECRLQLVHFMIKIKTEKMVVCKETALSRYLYCEQSCDCRCSEKKN